MYMGLVIMVKICINRYASIDIDAIDIDINRYASKYASIDSLRLQLLLGITIQNKCSKV